MSPPRDECVRVVRIQSRICVGGPALHSILLAEGLSRRAGSRYDTVLLSGALEPGEACMDDVARTRGVEIETIPEMRRSVSPGRDLRALARVVEVLRRVKPTIVHTHTAKAGAVGRLAARIARVPIVLHTFHGHVFDGYFSPARTRAFIAVERSLARATDQILAISEQQRRDLVERYRIAPSDKVRVIPLGLDLRAFQAVEPRAEPVGALRRACGIDAGARVVVTVGRLVPIKRFDVLIDAFLEVAAGAEDVHLVIVGEGELRSALEARSGGHPRIHFTGLRRDLPDIYADVDLMALSSDNEGTPVAVIEALASGVPVVATDVGGVRDVLRAGTGTIVPPGNVSALAEAMRARLATPLVLSLAQRKDIVARYSHTRLLSDMESLYDRLVEARRIPRRWMARAEEGLG